MTKNDFDKELEDHGIDTKRNHLQFNELVEIITDRYYSGGAEDEITDTFRIFDRRNKGSVSFNEVKGGLQSRLEVPVTESEILEMFEMAGIDPEGPVTERDFMKL